MKNLLLIVCVAAFAACNMGESKTAVAGHHANAAPVTDPAKFTTVEWMDSISQNLGTITEGQTVEIEWKFKNTGNQPLVIESANGSCGCTDVKYPTEPIAPGAQEAIRAKFDSKGKPGHNDKYVTVMANLKNHNSGSNTVLRFSAEVK